MPQKGGDQPPLCTLHIASPQFLRYEGVDAKMPEEGLRSGLVGLEEGKVVFVHREKSLPLHLAQLVGQRTAVYIEVVGKLLPVEGDGKRSATMADGLIGEVGEQSVSDRLRGGVENLAGQV